MSSTWGEQIKMTIFGESHGPAIGLVIDGLPAGVELNLTAINKEMTRRAPGKSKMATARVETDQYIIESGMFKGKTTGMPICVLIPNSDQHSNDYSVLKDVMRPGHGDYPGHVKWNGCNDYRGGGSFSGRLTACLVFMGAVAKQLLAQENIYVGAHIGSVGNIQDRKFNPLGEERNAFSQLTDEYLPVLDREKGQAMEAAILRAREEKNSIGGTIECQITGAPVGLGEPYFDSVESRLAHAVFSVPAVKAIEFGKGFALGAMLGSEANDPMEMAEGKVKITSNNNGGILGGISNGMPIDFTVAIKPTPSIALPQNTINITTKKNTVLEITGRHDPCIVPRAVPVIEGIAAWTILDLLYLARRRN